jgi:hypothetical protein
MRHRARRCDASAFAADSGTFSLFRDAEPPCALDQPARMAPGRHLDPLTVDRGAILAAARAAAGPNSQVRRRSGWVAGMDSRSG